MPRFLFAAFWARIGAAMAGAGNALGRVMAEEVQGGGGLFEQAESAMHTVYIGNCNDGGSSMRGSMSVFDVFFQKWQNGG